MRGIGITWQRLLLSLLLHGSDPPLQFFAIAIPLQVAHCYSAPGGHPPPPFFQWRRVHPPPLRVIWKPDKPHAAFLAFWSPKIVFPIFQPSEGFGGEQTWGPSLTGGGDTTGSFAHRLKGMPLKPPTDAAYPAGGNPAVSPKINDNSLHNPT